MFLGIANLIMASDGPPVASDGPPVQEGGASESLGVDYDGLPDHPHSFAKEAARYALDATVPSHSAAGYELATFAGGCFWGVELFFRSLHGVVTTAVGYSQGSTPFPSYLQVCGGETGHAEVVQVRPTPPYPTPTPPYP